MKTVPKIGEMRKGQGIYLGLHPICDDLGQPVKDGTGQVIRHHFFVSVQDLLGGRRLGFNDAAHAIANLKKNLNRNGQYFEDNAHFLRTLLEGQYRGGWRAPSRDISMIMHQYKDTDRFSDTFSNRPDSFYGTSTKHPQIPNCAWIQRFDTSVEVCAIWRDNSQPTLWRPVRSVPDLEI